jgi:hypothetical protein
LKLAVKSGAISPGLLMLPNLAWMLFFSLDAGVRSEAPSALPAAESAARSNVLGPAGIPIGGDPLPVTFNGP